MTFDEYWNQYGELHAESCGGSIRLFAEEIWKSANENATKDAVPREAVQAAVDEIAAGVERAETNVCNGADATQGNAFILAYRDALDELRNHTGVTPSEVL